MFITEVKSAGGASELFRTRCFFIRTALKSSEHRVFSRRDGETIPALGALGVHWRRRIRRIDRFRGVIAFHTPRALPHGEVWWIVAQQVVHDRVQTVQRRKRVASG